MADQTKFTETNSPGSRRLKYGSNLFVLMIIAIVIVGLLAYLTMHYNRQYDWTTGGIFTLSPQTSNLLKEIDAKKQQVELIDFFNVDATSTAADILQAQQVHDLLDQYVRQSSYIKLDEPRGREELEKTIRERYTGETKPYKEAIADLQPLATAMTKFFQTQADGFSALSHTKDLSADDAREIEGIAVAFRKEFADPINKTREDIRKSMDSTSPDWSKAKSDISDVLNIVDEQLKQVTTSSSNPDAFSKVIRDYLTKAMPDYTAMLKQVDAYKDRIDKLSPLKVDDVLQAIGPNTLIVMSPDSVKVIATSDMFRADTANSPDPEHPKFLFQGEQAISTALMAVVQPNKPKVVFITVTPQGLLEGPYTEINDRLTKANFDVSEWSPPGMPRPDMPPPPETPPASGKDSNGKAVVWVVLPPDPPSQQEMMQGMPPPDPKPVIDAIKKHMDAGGNVLFLAEGASPMSAMSGGGFPYAALIKPFGIDVKDTFDILHNVQVSEDTTRAIPQLDFNTYPDTPITRPLQSLTTLFVGSPSQMGIIGAPTVVDIAQPVPPGANPQVILRTPASADIFASANAMSGNPQYDPKTDLKAPLPMGVASSRNGQRVVVIGNKLFLVNQLLQEQAVDIESGRVFYRFPGNAELMINCVSWLSGYENMIAVSPQANVAQRIESMSDAESISLRLGSFIVPPLLAIVIGTVIFFVRRRA